jgi:hypothetical protein
VARSRGQTGALQPIAVDDGRAWRFRLRHAPYWRARIAARVVLTVARVVISAATLGGGLTPRALIAGAGRELGGPAYAPPTPPPHFTPRSGGLAVGRFERGELPVARRMIR